MHNQPEKYRPGHTKIFFRAGILGHMEEVREDKIASVISLLTAAARGKAARIVFSKMQDQKLSLYCLQRTIRNYRIGKTWKWWQLWLTIKPNLKCTRFVQYKAEYEKKIRIAEANIGQAVSDCDKVAAEHKALIAQKNELTLAMKSGGSAVQDIIDKTKRVEEVVNDLKTQVDSTKSRLNAEEDQKVQIQNQCGRVKGDAERLRGDIKILDSKAESCEEDKAIKDNQIRTL